MFLVAFIWDIQFSSTISFRGSRSEEKPDKLWELGKCVDLKSIGRHFEDPSKKKWNKVAVFPCTCRLLCQNNSILNLKYDRLSLMWKRSFMWS